MYRCSERTARPGKFTHVVNMNRTTSNPTKDISSGSRNSFSGLCAEESGLIASTIYRPNIAITAGINSKYSTRYLIRKTAKKNVESSPYTKQDALSDTSEYPSKLA